MSRHPFPAFAAALLLFALLAPMAGAMPIAGHSSGSFSGASGCNWLAQCRIEDSAQGLDTRLRWGHYPFLGLGGSTLTAKDRGWSFDGSADDQVVAELVWRNTATFSLITPDLFDVDYTLTIAFTDPTSSGLTHSFGFSIFNSLNPPGDQLHGLSLADLSGLTFDLDGVLVSDLKFVLEPGADGTFNGDYWFNPENDVSRLYITADFSSAPASVPEPGALVMIAAGLAGLWLVQRRFGGGQPRARSGR